jgi:uncharacterized protein YndB with AHSA1/START domain
MSKPDKSTATERDYARRLTIEAPAERLFDAIATLDGLREWWTPLVKGSDKPGGVIRLEFEGRGEHIDLRVDTSRRPAEVEWSIIEHTSLEDWNGTMVRFELEPRGPMTTAVSFRHAGLSPKLECFDQCEAGWDHFLGSLTALVERGRGEPFRSAPRRRS